jgi:hypothetical protein
MRLMIEGWRDLVEVRIYQISEDMKFESISVVDVNGFVLVF